MTDVQEAPSQPATQGLDRTPTDGGSALVTSHGRTSIADSVVAKIAGLAAREISGVHAMGAGAARTFGSIREILPGNTESRTANQGVKVEVGERQAAIDLDIVVDYGVAIVDLAGAVRKNVIDRLQRMTGLEVTEVNINVDDIWIPGSDSQDDPSAPSSRVQ
ncbi:MAG: Asp23/Gls24 family envelope stress response protein [Acidimicrobiales bacterium]